MNRPSLRPQAGFTLVELLVVIAIIGLLISILLPALGKARLAGQNTVASTDMGGIGKAIFIYAADNKSWCPSRTPFQYTNGTAHNPVVAGATDFFLQRACPGWTIWAITNNTVNFGYGTDGEGPLGLGVLLSRPQSTTSGGVVHPSFTGYISSPLMFFHPLMRDPSTGGGTARHYFNATRNFGLFLSDPNILIAAPSSWTVGPSASNNINANGVMYRGGDWSPVDSTTSTPGAANTYDNRSGYNKLSQLRTDEGNGNQRVMLCNGPFENQIYRQGGICYYMTGDGAVRATVQPEFWYPRPPSLGGSVGVAAQNANLGYDGSPRTQNGITTVMPAYYEPGAWIGNSPGLGCVMTQMSYIIEQRVLGLY